MVVFLNKKLKKWLFSWTRGRGNYMFDMLEDFLDVFIGGMLLFFADLKIEKVDDIAKGSTASWDRRFNFKFGTFERCSCCNRSDLPPQLLQTLEEYLGQITAKEAPMFSPPTSNTNCNKDFKTVGNRLNTCSISTCVFRFREKCAKTVHTCSWFCLQFSRTNKHYCHSLMGT